MRLMTVMVLLCLQLGCDGGGGGPSGTGAKGGSGGSGTGGGAAGSPVESTPDQASAQDAAGMPPGQACPSGTDQCGDSALCCPTGTECLANPYGQYCQTEFCCIGCPGGTACGAGCCPSGTACSANDGASACDSSLCCAAQSDPECPGDVASQCPAGTACVANHSAKACGDFACYTADGFVACPGEVACPNGTDFCPGGLHCLGLTAGVCEQSSSSGNYCCKAAAGGGDSCDHIPCADGYICVPNPYCPDTDPSASSICRKGTCDGDAPVDCGNYCCGAAFPVCAGDCYCNAQ